MAQNPLSMAFSLGAALAAATRRRLAFARLLPFAPLPRGDGTAFRRGLRRELRRVLRRGSIVNTHSRGLHREHARPGQPIFLSGRRRHGASTFFLGVAGMARPLSLSLAGRARNTDGTHPRASSGARSAVSGLFPEASVAGMAASLICLRPARPYGAESVST